MKRPNKHVRKVVTYSNMGFVQSDASHTASELAQRPPSPLQHHIGISCDVSRDPFMHNFQLFIDMDQRRGTDSDEWCPPATDP